MAKENEIDDQKIIDENAAETAAEETKDSSAFSEDGVETEIEVDPEDSKEKAKKKRRKKKEREANGENNLSTENSSAAEEGRVSVSSEKDLKKRPQKKVGYLEKIKAFTPLLIIVAAKIALFIPIAVYACDIFISLNVLENGLQYVNDFEKNNISELDRSALLADYTHPHRNAIMTRVEYWIRQRSKRDINETDNSTVGETTVTTTPTFDITTDFSFISAEVSTLSNEATSRTNTGLTAAETGSISQTTQPTSSDSTTPQNEETTGDTTMYTTANVTTEATTKNYIFEGEFCYTLHYFVNLHKEYNNEHNLDWYDTVYSSLRRYQKALFYMFTIGGFIFLMMAIVMRCELFINKSWSSYLLLTFVMYTISTSLTGHVFAVQSGHGGLRCFLCRVTSYCLDKHTGPWNFQFKEYFPHDSLNWTFVALLSFVFKLYDCFMMGLATLWIIHDGGDPWYASLIKFGGWLVIFPLMVFTPLFGVIRYDVLPVTVDDSSPAYLGFSIVFWIGVIFWAISLIILPILCKAKMCSEGEEYYDDETEEYGR